MKDSLFHCTDLELKQSSELSVLLNINCIDAGYFDSQILSLFIKWGEVYAKVELWVRVEQVVIGHNALKCRVPLSSSMVDTLVKALVLTWAIKDFLELIVTDNFMVG